MEPKLRDKFIRFWDRYFPGAELPLAFYFIDDIGDMELSPPTEGLKCFATDLLRVRRGECIAFHKEALGCPGARKYLGFTQTHPEEIDHFLAGGLPGVIEGIRYKKNLELATASMKNLPEFKAPGKYAVWKRWDLLETTDSPEVIVFFTQPDVLSGLFFLANYDRAESTGVHSPFASGCASIVMYPHIEKHAEKPRAVIGMFDPSARQYLSDKLLTFSVPMNRFLEMIENMEESFLGTKTWSKLSRRIKRTHA